jgi:hypothetical protein
MAEAVTRLTYLRKVYGSNLSRYTDYRNSSQPLQENAPG